MSPITPGMVRNIGIVAHIDGGKTTTTERFLYYAGKSHKLGEVHDGEAVMDFRADERERGITISDAATTMMWDDYRINLIDTPGHVDFTAEVERALRVLDGALVIFDSVEGVEPQSETVWHQADRYQVPRLAMANKMDRVGADFEMTVRSIRERLQAVPIPIQIPDGSAEDFKGIVDLVEMRYLTFDAGSLGRDYQAGPVPETMAEQAGSAREEMIEALADFHDPLAELFLDGKEIPKELLHEAIRTATLGHHAVPVLCGAALRNIGIQPVLDAICRYLPAPTEIAPVEGTTPDGSEVVVRNPLGKEPFCALLFKVTANEAADMFFLRVYSGKLESGTKVLNPRSGKVERLKRFLRMHADRGEKVDQLEPGDIVTVTGLKFAVTGDTLCDLDHPILLEPIRFPDSVVSIAIEPRTNAERERFGEIIEKFQREDPSLQCKVDGETGQTLLSGMGELHLEVVLARMEREFRLKVSHGKPRVTYRETVARAGSGEAVYERKVAGEELRARVRLDVKPLADPGAPVEVDSRLPEFELSPQLLKGVLESMRNAGEGGGVYGYAVTGVQVTLAEAEFADAGQPEIALNSATSHAFREAVRQAGSVVLEPYGKLEVRVPEDYLGGVMKSLNQRRVMVSDTGYLKNAVVIKGVAPIAEMFGYLTELRSASQGRGSFSFEPLDYRPVPDALTASQHQALYS